MKGCHSSLDDKGPLDPGVGISTIQVMEVEKKQLRKLTVGRLWWFA